MFSVGGLHPYLSTHGGNVLMRATGESVGSVSLQPPECCAWICMTALFPQRGNLLGNPKPGGPDSC